MRKKMTEVSVDTAILDKRRGVIGSILLVLFVNLFFFKPFGWSGVATLLVGLWLYVLVLLGGKVKRVAGIVGGSGLLVIGVSIQMLFIADWVKLATLLLLGLFVVVTLYYHGLIERRLGGLYELLIMVPRLIAGYVMGVINVIFESIGSLVKNNEPKTNSKLSIGRWWIGLLMGIPIVLLLTKLLAQGDPIFSSFISQLVRFEISGELQARIILSSILFLTLMPVVFVEMKRQIFNPVALVAKRAWESEATIVLVMVAMVIGVFLVVQWPYIFVNVAKETDLSKFGVATYSEYVTRGFGELVSVVGVLWGVSWMAILTSSATSKKWQKLLIMLHAVLGVEVVLFIVSIMRRVWLYQEYHGLTLARIYGMAFLVWLSGMLVSQASRYIKKTGIIVYEIIWTVLIVFGTIWLNPEKLVESNPPTINGKVDYLYLSEFSYDGYKGMVDSYKWAKNILETADKRVGVIKLEERREIWYATWVIGNVNSRVMRIDWNRNPDLWAWSYARQKYAKTIENDIPAAEIDQMQKIGNRLIERIARQPKGENNVDFDRDTKGYITSY